MLIGASDGRMQLWNFETRKLVFTFAGCGGCRTHPLRRMMFLFFWLRGDIDPTRRVHLSPNRRHGSAVRSLAMSPALDVVGVGLADGRLVLHNLKFDTVITSFLHDSTGGAGPSHSHSVRTFPFEGLQTMVGRGNGGTDFKSFRLSAASRAGAVTALSFSRGSTALVAAGGLSGAITVWRAAAPARSPRFRRVSCRSVPPPARARQPFCRGKFHPDKLFRRFSPGIWPRGSFTQSWRKLTTGRHVCRAGLCRCHPCFHHARLGHSSSRVASLTGSVGIPPDPLCLQVVSLHFMPHQPVLMSAAADNAIKHWAFDQDVRCSRGPTCPRLSY